MQLTLYKRTTPVVAKAIAILPLAPPNALLALLVRRMVRRHSGIIERLSPIVGTAFEINITDLRLTVLLCMKHGTITAQFARNPLKSEVKISGTLPVLIALLEGDLDGDALFFARELTISGDTEALLTLRNALDSEDFSLRQEILAAAGPFGPAFDRMNRALAGTPHKDQNWQSRHL